MRANAVTRLTAIAGFAWTVGISPAQAEARLLMFEENGCPWCQMWTRDIGEIYDRTSEGKTAPLVRIDIHDPAPHGFSLKTAVQFTPTFVLVSERKEVGRIEGYPGEDFFWGMLGQMIDRLPEAPSEGKLTSAGMQSGAVSAQ
jgi:thioredoxin-related protein